MKYIQDSVVITTLLNEYEKHQDEKLYHGERLKREQQEAVDKAVAEAVAEKDAYIKELEAKLAMQTA